MKCEMVEMSVPRPDKVYAVKIKHLSVPPGIFICCHCAEKWGDFTGFSYSLVDIDTSLFCEFIDKANNI